jgi:hypothetical protein
VHQLRYRLGFGDKAGHVLSDHGHGYMTTVAPIVSLLLAAVIGQLLWAVCQQAAPGRPHRISAGRLWLLIAAALLGLYTGQELLEGVLAPGHPAGLAGVLDHDGWTAAPLALVVAGAITVALRVASAVDASDPPLLLAAPLPKHAAPLALVAVIDGLWPSSSPLALCGAGRAPPRGT